MKRQWCYKEGSAGYGESNADHQPTSPGSCTEAKKLG